MSTSATTSTLHVGPAEIELHQAGNKVALIGHYRATPGGSQSARAELHVRLWEGFVEGREKTANHPKFDNALASPTTLELNRFDGRGRIDFTDPARIVAHFEGHSNSNTLEAMIRIVASVTLPGQDTLILHSSAIESDGLAHVFAGVSGAGKSTIADLLRTHYPVEVLSDELLLLRKLAGAWHLEVAPFTGKIPLPHGKCTKLASVNFLAQATTHSREPVGLRDSMTELPKHVVAYVNHPLVLAQVLNLVGDVVESTPCYRLAFAKRADVGSVLELPCL